MKKATGKYKKIKKIAMLTIHGYVSPTPTLGKTDTGGQVTYVLELSKALAKKGIKVDIYTRQFQKRKSIEKVCRNVRIVRIPCGGQKFIPKEQLLPYLDTYVKNMHSFIQKHDLKYDIIHSHYWDAGYVAMNLAKKIDYFFVSTFHSLGAWKKENMGGDPKKMEKLYRFKERIRNEKVIYKNAKGIVMTSSKMVKSSTEFYNFTTKNYSIIPAGVNTDFFKPLPKTKKDRKIDVPQNYIFWVGRFDTNKGLDYLLKGFSEIVRKEKDLFLVIGGGSKIPKPKEKKLKKELKSIIKKKDISSRIFFTGHIKNSEMPTYYRKAKFFVLPSKFEPFGMTAAEAMACGTPLVVNRRAGITKFLKNGENALIINANNKKDLGKAFRTMNRRNTLRKRIAKNGQKLAKEIFGWDSIAIKSLMFYNKLIKEYAASNKKPQK